MSAEKWLILSILIAYLVNLILTVISFYMMKKAMRKQRITWSGSYDAMASAVVIYCLIPVIGGVMILLAILSGEVKNVR